MISLCTHTFLKNKQTSISFFMRDSGNEFHALSNAYEHTIEVLVDLLAKLKLVTF